MSKYLSKPIVVLFNMLFYSLDILFNVNCGKKIIPHRLFILTLNYYIFYCLVGHHRNMIGTFRTFLLDYERKNKNINKRKVVPNEKKTT